MGLLEHVELLEHMELMGHLELIKQKYSEVQKCI